MLLLDHLILSRLLVPGMSDSMSGGAIVQLPGESVQPRMPGGFHSIGSGARAGGSFALPKSGGSFSLPSSGGSFALPRGRGSGGAMPDRPGGFMQLGSGESPVKKARKPRSKREVARL